MSWHIKEAERLLVTCPNGSVRPAVAKRVLAPPAISGCAELGRQRPSSFAGQTQTAHALTLDNSVAFPRSSAKYDLVPLAGLGDEPSAVLETEVTYMGERNSGQCPVGQGHAGFGPAIIQFRRKLIAKNR